MLTKRELYYAINHQKTFISNIRYGGPYGEMMYIYEQWKSTGSQELHIQLQVLARIYDRYLSKRKGELDWAHKFLLELEFQLETGLSLHDIKICEVPQLSDRALDLLVSYKYGTPTLNFGTRTKNHYYSAVVAVVTNHHSCSHCKGILHTRKQCPN